MEVEQIKQKVKTALGVHAGDILATKQVEQHTDAGLHFFMESKGIDPEVMKSESGVLLLAIYVSDVWKNAGSFEFSPATESLFNALMDETVRRRYAE